jgi:tRNA-modifying protein YgfZ
MPNPGKNAEIFEQDEAAFQDTPWGQVALNYGDWQAEYWAFREAAGLFWPPSVAQVEIAGKQRAAFLNRLATNKLDGISPGDGVETFLADSNGRILFHVFVYAGPDSLILHTAAGLGTPLCQHLDHYLIREDVQIHDRSLQWGELILAGPKSTEIVRRLVAVDLPDNDEYLAACHTEWNGRLLMVRCLQQRGFQNFQLAGHVTDMGSLWQALQALGATPCGVRALEAVRIEEGFPVPGLEITERTLPQELGRNAQAISFNKGCYLGQEIVARIDSRDAVNKALCGIRFQTAALPSGSTELKHDGQAAGQITSATYSPGFGGIVALGYVRRQFQQSGTVLDSAWGSATVVELPMRGWRVSAI